ncbi:MAG: protein kinase [Planctomycetota bacterium]
MWSFGGLQLTSSQRRPAAASLRPGEVFAGRYRIEATLGAGGMGQVFRAREAGLDRAVAIKLLTQVDEQRSSRFVREGELLAALTHPGIVRVHGGGVTAEGQPFLVMEEVEGARELDRCLREAGLDGGLDLLEQVADAVAYAHARGVIHRDLKPGNVLVDAGGRARVCDFGLAWREDLDRLTRTGALVGTPLYMAPEQMGLIAGRGPTPAADVWSLGVMLYEHLTGELPFFGATLVELMSAIGTTDPRPAHELSPAVSPALSAVCQRALQRDPARRYAQAGELAAALRDARRQRGGSGRLLRAWLTAAGVLAAGLLGWLAGRGPGPAAAAPARATPSASTRAPEPAAPDDALTRLAALEGLACPADELYQAFARALEAAREPGTRSTILLRWARAAWARAHWERVLEATRGLEAREARYLRASALVALGRAPEAQGLLVGLRDQEDRWGLLAAAQLGLSRGEDPAPLLRRLRARDPGDQLLGLIEAHACAARGERAGELRIHESLGPAGEALVLVLLGKAEYWLGPQLGPGERDLERAAALLERARRLGAPDHTTSYYSAAAHLATLRGDHATAEGLLREAHQRRPHPALAYLLGIALEELGRPREAEEVWRAASVRFGKAFLGVVDQQDVARKLRIERAIGQFVILDPRLPLAAQRWLDAEAKRLSPDEERQNGRTLLEACLRGRPWHLLAPGVTALRARPSAAAERVVGFVALARDRLELGRAALETAQRLAPSAEVALWLAEADARESGGDAAIAGLERLLARWPADPVAPAARALLGLLRREPVAFDLADALPDDAGPNTRVRALGYYASGRWSEAFAACELAMSRAAMADLFSTVLRIHALRQLVRQQPSEEGWRQLFASAELVFGLTDDPLLRLDVAEEALHLGQRTPWLASASVWIAAAERPEEPPRGARAQTWRWRLGEVRGLRLLLAGRSEVEVLAEWRGAPPEALGERTLETFRARFGHPPPRERGP